jgi:hypothetical protein
MNERLREDSATAEPYSNALTALTDTDEIESASHLASSYTSPDSTDMRAQTGNTLL